MRILSLSLITVVMLSILAFGWLLNQVYVHTSLDAKPSSENTAYQDLGRQVLGYYLSSPNPSLFIQNWNNSGAIQLSLLERDYFPLPPVLREKFDRGEALVLESEGDIGVHFAMRNEEKVFSVSVPQSQVEPDNKVELILTLSFYTGVTTIIIIWIWPLIHQLMRLRDAAVEFGKGELGVRVRLQKFSYIRDIENEFNHMAERIQSLLRDNKLLSRAVSHDLKTPLARLRFGLDALSETQNEAQRQRYAVRVNRDLEAMEDLIDNLLQYARLDENRIKITDEKICLVTLSSVIMQTNETSEKAMRFQTLLPNAEIRGDKRYISMLINNLLSNALRYSRDEVLVSLLAENGAYCLVFEDNGEGIPEEERDNVRKPFWRGVDDRAEKGHGMGLAIVDRIAEWHKASLEIGDSAVLGGAKVSVRFLAENKTQ